MARLKVPALRAGGNRPASKSRGRGFLVGLGAIGVVAAVTLLTVGYNSPKGIPGRSYYNLQAAFTNADNLTQSYQVRIGGRLVGQVLNPRVDKGEGVVDLQLNPDVEPLLSDTTLKVRPRSPVGVRFVELVPGTKGRPLGEDDRIPSSQTSATVQLDQALDTLDADRRAKAQVLLNELGKGFLGRGEDINEAQSNAPRFLGDLQDVASEVTAQPNVRSFVGGAESAAAAADPVREDIARGFDPEARAMRPFVQERDAIRSTLTTAPGDLRSVQSGLARVSPMLSQLERFGRSATPAFRQASTTLAGTSKLFREADPGLEAARKTLGLASEAVPPTLQLLRTLQPVLPDLDATLASANPVLTELSPRECDMNRFFGNWNETLAYGDGFSNVLRFNVIASLESIQGYNGKPLGRTTKQSPYPAPCEIDRQTFAGGR
ncbi:MlaD family protein [Conexibacter sp. SYSU D00693]|uniref:MlaD family protein n=1 Tax=Conexibacter sp. SYSU D00693 TaxID=2812560 RepID=UPI00196A7B90|nr:MCE family protein [Conexibacter sp. SYSU D00693]